jgi:hypothetical protein
MILVHLADGRTERYDLRDDRYAAAWMERIQESSFQDSIRAISVQQNGVMYAVARPVEFDRIHFFAESLPPNESQKFKGGERVYCHADEVRVSVMVHPGQRAARLCLSKPGRQCYIPWAREPELWRSK